jgi:hypothetical protein
MANISVLSTDKNNFRNLGNSIYYSPFNNSLRIFVPENFRIFFEQGAPSLFPKNSEGNYAGGGTVLINFQTGEITGKDEASSDFTPVIPSQDNFVAVTVALDRNSELTFFKGSEGSLSVVRSGVLSGSSVYLGVPPVNSIKLFTVLLTSSNGVDVSTVTDDKVISYLGNLNLNVPSDRVLYSALGTTTGSDDGIFLNSSTETIIKEPFLTDIFAGDNKYLTSRTSVKVGDTLQIERIVGSTLQKTQVVVTNVIKGVSNDTVEFSPALTTPHILELRPKARVVNPTVNNLTRGLYQKNRRMVFDSGWITVSLGSTANLSTVTQTWVPDPINLRPFVVWNSIKNSNNVIVLSDPFRSDGGQRIGVQLTVRPSSISYEIGSSGVFYNLETSQLVTTGFIRIFLREV